MLLAIHHDAMLPRKQQERQIHLATSEVFDRQEQELIVSAVQKHRAGLLATPHRRAAPGIS